MLSAKVLLVLSIALVAVINAKENTLECWGCTSLKQDGCGSKFNKKTAIQQKCYGAQDICFIEVIDNTYTRRCGESKYCKKNCTACKKSLCNFSSRSSAQYSLITMGAAAVIVMKVLRL